MKPQEALIECPFCEKMTIRVLRIPFIKQTITSKCRAGGRNTKYQREKDEVLSGCSECGKSKKEVEEALETSAKEITPEKLKKRLKEAGLPTVIESKVK
jgi:heterodisulfide reductase subunit B